MKYWQIEWKSHRYPNKSYKFVTFFEQDYFVVSMLVHNIKDYHTICETFYRIVH